MMGVTKQCLKCGKIFYKGCTVAIIDKKEVCNWCFGELVDIK